MPVAFDQSRYQVRLEWGMPGLARLAPADVVVIVDVLGEAATWADAVASGETVVAAGPVAEIADAAGEAIVLVANLRNASAVADEILAVQQRRAQRTSISIVAVGDADARGVRLTVEDQFGAGAVIDALAARGIDHTSPEAAVACESFRGLRRAVRHLMTASGSGQQLLDEGRRDDVLTAADIDAVRGVPVRRDDAFIAA